MKTRLAFVLVVAFCHLSQGNKLVGSERAGECPKPSDTFGTCTFDPETNCVQDNECSEGLKCCADQCGRICKSPLQVAPPSARALEKPGQCPAPSGSVGICQFDPKNKNSCLSDQDCLYGLKCCSDQCGRICKSAIPLPLPPRQASPQEKPGQCPTPSGSVGICSVDPKTSCANDQDCLYGLKCCSDQCGRICKSPLPPPPSQSLPQEKPGQCPASSGSVGICLLDSKDSCFSDQDCLYGLKCCSDQCGRICKNPLAPPPPPRQRLSQEKPGQSATQVSPPRPPVPPRQPQQKPGQCPTPVRDKGICIVDPTKNCIGDQDCLNDKKCCFDGCGRTCKSAAQVSPPTGSLVPPPPQRTF